MSMSQPRPDKAVSGSKSVHRDSHDTGVGNGQPVGSIFVVVVTDFHALRNAVVLVDDGSLDSSVAADLNSTEEDGVFDVGPAVNLHFPAKYGMLDPAARDD